MNKVLLIGHLGGDPERKDFQDSSVVNFSLATNESYKNKSGEKTTTTEWHKIVMWGKLAEIADEYLVKGSQVLIEGKLKYRSYDNKEGVKVYVTEIVAEKMKMLSSAKKEDVAPALPLPIEDDVNINEDLPF